MTQQESFDATLALADAGKPLVMDKPSIWTTPMLIAVLVGGVLLYPAIMAGYPVAAAGAAFLAALPQCFRHSRGYYDEGELLNRHLVLITMAGLGVYVAGRIVQP